MYVCTSVACHLRNAKDVYDAIWEEARDQGLGDTEIREFECLGACDMAPMASIDGRYVGPARHEEDARARSSRPSKERQRSRSPDEAWKTRDTGCPWDKPRWTDGLRADD